MITIEQIWQTYREQLYQFIKSRVADVVVAEDILQEVFIKIHTRLDTVRDDRQLRGWIYRIARNCIIDYYRADRLVTKLPHELIALETEYSNKARQEIGDCLIPMIEQLPEKYRQAVMLSEIDGMKQKEIATQHGISLSGAKSRVQRGRKMLREMLLACCCFEFDHQGTMIDYEVNCE
jgi:RNA polymerase sigma-70 factor (ECF subfamily)